MLGHFAGVVGIVVILTVCYFFSDNRKKIAWKYVGFGLLLQIVFAVSILGIPALGIQGIFRFVFEGLNTLVTSLVDFTSMGSKFLFGPLAEVKEPWGFVFALRALPPILFFSALMAGLYHIGVLQAVVRNLARVMQWTMKTSGAETLSAAANIFIGQTEAPLLVRPYLAKMTKSEIYCVMVAGMATVAAGVEGAYVGLLKDRMPDIAGHLLTASTMGAIGALIVSKIIVPETEKPLTQGSVDLKSTDEAKSDSNFLEALARGGSEGIGLALNVAAMLIVFITLIAIFDAFLGKIGAWLNLSDTISFAFLMGKIFQPFAWLVGIPWEETATIGHLLGEKVVMNEFVAYVHLAEKGSTLSDRSLLIASYALCGFANFSSIGIQLGGLGSLAGNQKSNLAKLGFKAVLGGNLACLLSACIAGLLF